MYRLIILSAIILASFSKALSCNNTYDAGAYQKVKCQYNFANCSNKCREATGNIQKHILDIWSNKAFEFNRSTVSLNDRSANDMLHSYILFFNCYRIKTILSI